VEYNRVFVMTSSGLVPGCFCVKTAHIAGPKGKGKIPSYEEVFLDVGADSMDALAALGIHVGDPIVYATSLEKMGNRVMGKSLDNRIGLTMIIILAERLSKISASERPAVTFVSTVMEELGAKGAAAIAQELDVDGVLIAEIGLADDYPGTAGEAGVSLGREPVIVVKDTQIHYSNTMNQNLFTIAEKESIPVQRAVYHNYATDGFQIASRGEKVAVIAVPCRYSHSSFEMIELRDMQLAIDLFYNYLTKASLEGQ
jgi:putative aminopeptidase FrvX